MGWTTPRTWTPAEVVTAALLNTHLRDNLNAIGAAWTSYTPTWTSSGTAPTLGDGTLTGRYLQAGKLVLGSIYLQTGSTTTYGTGLYRFALPVTAGAATAGHAFGRIFDTSASANYIGGGYLLDVNTLAVLHPTGSWGATTPFTAATGDTASLMFLYEAA